MDIHLNEFVVKLQKKRNQIVGVREQQAQLRATNESVTQQLEEQEGTLNLMIDEEREMQSEVARLRGALNDAEQRHRVLSHTLNETRNKLRGDVRRQESLEIVLHDLEERYHRSMDKRASDQNSVDEVTRKLSSMALEHTDVASRHEEAMQQVARKESELAQLKEDLTQIKLIVGSSIAGS